MVLVPPTQTERGTLPRMFVERRAAPREKLALAIRLDDGSLSVTDNLSCSGLCLRMSGHQALADEVSFRLHQPDARLTFVGDAKVVRRELRDGETFVALRFVTARLKSID